MKFTIYAVESISFSITLFILIHEVLLHYFYTQAYSNPFICQMNECTDQVNKRHLDREKSIVTEKIILRFWLA